MKVLKATEEQYNKLNGFTNGLHSLVFIKDADNNWITSESILTDENFYPILSDLIKLESIDFNPNIFVPGQESTEYVGS
jgi:hypothetical protein